MIAGVYAWGELLKAAFGTVSTGLAATEVGIASGKVVGARMTIIGDALRRPMDCDYVELGGMLPEKILAFSKSASVLFDYWVSTMLDVSEQAHQTGLLALEGRASFATTGLRSSIWWFSEALERSRKPLVAMARLPFWGNLGRPPTMVQSPIGVQRRVCRLTAIP